MAVDRVGGDTRGTHHLAVVVDGQAVEVVDEVLETWSVRFEPLPRVEEILVADPSARSVTIWRRTPEAT